MSSISVVVVGEVETETRTNPGRMPCVHTLVSVWTGETLVVRGGGGGDIYKRELLGEISFSFHLLFDCILFSSLPPLKCGMWC